MTEPEAAEPASAGPTLAALRAAGRVLLRLGRVGGVVVAALWMTFIWTLSAQSFPDEEFVVWEAWVANLAHAPLFGLLALWWLPVVLARAEGRGLPPVGAGRAVLTVGLVLAFGFVDEWHQSQVPGRDPSLQDIATDVVGALCVLAVAGYVARPDATDAGTWRRLGLGLLACGAAAMVATLT